MLAVSSNISTLQNQIDTVLAFVSIESRLGSYLPRFTATLTPIPATLTATVTAATVTGNQLRCNHLLVGCLR